MSTPGGILWENFQKGKEKHSALCNINDGLCGECMQEFYDWQEKFEAKKPLKQREIEALDSCISSEIGENIPWSSSYVHEVRSLFAAMSEQEKEDKREVWRKKFYKKFAKRDDWAELGETFWDKSYSMMKAAKVVYQKKMADEAKATPLDAEVTSLDAKATPLDAKATSFDAKATPLDAEVTPLDAKATPLDAKATPLDAEVTSLDAKATPLDAEVTSLEAKATPLDAEATHEVPPEETSQPSKRQKKLL